MKPGYSLHERSISFVVVYFRLINLHTLNPKLLLIFLLLISVQSYSQTFDSVLDKIDPEKWFVWEKRVSPKDSLLSKAKLAEIQSGYKELWEKLKPL